MDTSTKVRENRARRAAARQRLTLHKTRRRDPRAWDYGRWWLIPERGRAIGAWSGRAGDPPGLTLDEVEETLGPPGHD